MEDFWIANVANGSCIQEEWIAGEFSPWVRLMQYCKNNNTYLTGLRLAMAQQTFDLPMQAQGYWQSHAMPSVQGIECDEELHKWRGIGAVHNGVVYIIWAARDPQTHELAAWEEQRPAHDQNQIIWSRPNIQIPTVFVQDQNELNSKLYTDKILGAANN